MTNLEDSARQLVIDGERALRAARNREAQRAALLPQYQLGLKVLARGKRPLGARADDYLRIVRAMRDDQEYADLGEAGDDDAASVERMATSPLRVLMAYVERLPGTVVLVLESGAGVLTFFALRGGTGPVEDRVVLARAGDDCVAAMTALMRQQADDVEAIGRREAVSRALYDPIARAADALWPTLPAPIRTCLSTARTVLYLPSAFGDLSAFPLELVRADGEWLGATRAVARLHSLRTLLELLSPGRMPARLAPSALVVRAQDSEELALADEEARRVLDPIRALGLAAERDARPSVASVRDALDAGRRVLHYCGHGFAGRFAESLPVTADERLGPADFSALSGVGTPFVYLSTCEVGRARMATTGNAIGVAARLIEKGAPAVIGCLASVPDLVAQSMALAFYRAAAAAPVGEALAAARRELLKYPPACWGAFACFGDPALRLAAQADGVDQTRRATVRWDTFVGRHAALRSDATRQRALDAIAAAARDDDPPTAPWPALAAWLESSFAVSEPALKDERLALCLRVAAVDAVAGCELRALLAMEALHGAYMGPRRPDLVLLPDEIGAGLVCSKAVHDTLAWAAFAIEAARTAIGHAPTTLARMLEQAAGMLDGWALEEPAAGAMAREARDLIARLREQHGVGAT